MGEKDGAEARALWHSSQGLLASWDVCVCVCVCVVNNLPSQRPNQDVDASVWIQTSLRSNFGFTTC